MRVAVTFICFIFLGASFGGPVAAMSLPSEDQAALRGFQTFRLQSVGDDEDSAACGVTPAHISAAAKTAAAQTPLTITEDESHPATLTFFVMTFRTRDRCISEIFLFATYDTVVRLPRRAGQWPASVTLWVNETMVVTEHNKDAHLIGVAEGVINHILVMADAWADHNAKPAPSPAR